MSFVEDQDEKSKGGIKTILMVGGGIIVFALAKGIGGFVGHATANQFVSGYQDASADEQIETGMNKLTAELRPQLPLKLDEITSLVGVAHIGKQMRYMLTIDGELDPSQIQDLKLQQIGQNRSNVCAKPDVQKLFDHGVTMTWQYTDSAGHQFEALVDHC